MKRKAIPLKVQLAAALLQTKYGQRHIPYEDTKQMTADQIISLFQLDHYPIRHADGGSDEPWNLTWRFIGEHREKTKRDVAEMAKSKRIRKKYAQPVLPIQLTVRDAEAADYVRKKLETMDPKRLHRAMRAVGLKPRPISEWPKRKIPSRPFSKGRKFNRRKAR